MLATTNSKRRKERGQTTILFVVALATFLLAFVGLATDYTNFWFTRQAAQGAADATCQAAAMDLYLSAVGQATGKANFTPSGSSSIQCTSSPTPAPCYIAKYNGFDGTTAGNTTVAMSFPSSVPNPPPGDGSDLAFQYVKVDVTRNQTAYFSQLLTGKRTVAVHTSATCGLGEPTGPVPITVLHPTMTDAILMNGSGNLITVQGGPIQSIQVNSKAAEAVYLGSVDLSKAGPQNNGGNLGVFGGPATATAKGTLSWGTRPGGWLYPSPPIADPYRKVAQPSTTPPTGTITTGCYSGGCNKPGLSDCVALSNQAPGCYKYNGCPDPGGCDEYTAGYYNHIGVKNRTAIFDPGLYWVEGGLNLDTGSNVRTSTATGDGSGGVMFFFKGSPTQKCSGGTTNGAYCVDANSGKGTNPNSGKAIDLYYVDGSTSPNGVPSRALQCPGGGSNPSGLPSTISGNVLLGPCPGKLGISPTYGDPSKQYRGFIFWQDRANVGNAQWQGGGQSLVSGFMYFHQCNSNGTGTEPCPAPPTAFGDTFNLGGNPGSATYTLGSIVTDAIATNGTPNITMVLNPYNSFPLLKVYLLQ